MNIETLENKIVEAIKPFNPDKIVLFGSYAWGNPEKDSDLDIYVVLNDEFMPQTWKEKSTIYLKVISALEEMQKSIPIDLIAHTKPMHRKFIEMDSMFCRKIMRDGKQLL